MKSQYYLTAYGPQMRQSERCNSPTEAALYCWGVSTRVTSLAVGGRRTLTMAQRLENQQRLAERHFAMTGNKLWDSHYVPPDEFPLLQTLADLHRIAAYLTADPPKGRQGQCLVVVINPTAHIGTTPLATQEGAIYALAWGDEKELTRYAFDKNGKFLGFTE